MTRYIRNSLLQAKIESAYGSDPGSWVASNGVLIRHTAPPKIVRDLVDRALARGYFGGSDQMVASRRMSFEFEVELASSGAAGTAPAWGPLARACGMAETITATNRVEYTPVTNSQESVTLRYFLDGVVYVARGCRGNMSIDLPAYGLPVAKFAMQGFDSLVTEIAVAQSDFTAWKRPPVITDGNTADISLGVTYTAGVLSGGTALVSQGLSLDLGNRVEHAKLLGGESIDITGREATGRMSVALAAADEVTWRTDINGNVVAALGFQIGADAGSIVGIYAPAVQRVDPQAEDYQGRAMVGAELRLLPSATTGNDELRIIAR